MRSAAYAGCAFHFFGLNKLIFCFWKEIDMIKNKKLKQLALFGLASGLLINGHSSATESVKQPSPPAAADDPNKGNLGYHLMDEDELLLELNDQGLKTYNSLSSEGKALARFVASQRCGKSNECKGLNACKTDENECAGQGKCKGQGKCAIADKNLAVDIVSKKMAEKRKGLTNSHKQK
jgi:hypothetical protein